MFCPTQKVGTSNLVQMNLHDNLDLYKDAIVATSQMTGIPEIYVEKDYWLTAALHSIFTSEVGNYSIFKGGTALSKCFSAFERFSEDIDIVLLKDGSESSNQLKSRLKKITIRVSSVIPEIELPGITNKFGMIRKTAHSYSKSFEGKFGQVNDFIILETTWLGGFEPYTYSNICSYVSEIMEKTGQLNLIEKYNLQPFQVKILGKERTLCEKVMSLVRFSFSPDPIFDLSNKIRHIYDIHKLLSFEDVKTFFKSDEFESLLKKVARDDIVSFKNNNKWLANHPSKAIIFSDTLNTWKQIRKIYFTSFSQLVYGVLPTEDQLLCDLDEVGRRLKNIEWIV